MRPYRGLLRGKGVLFAARSSADCITNMSGFDLRQAQAFGMRPLTGGIEGGCDRLGAYAFQGSQKEQWEDCCGVLDTFMTISPAILRASPTIELH
jgi:hypothetical protein